MFDIRNTGARAKQVPPSAAESLEERATMVALQAVGQYLVDAGLVLGKDFSFSRGSLMVNDATLEHLRQKLGPDHFNHIMAMVPGLLQHQSHE